MRLRRALLATLLPAALVGPLFVHMPSAAGGAICHSESLTQGKGQVVEMRNNCFSPMVLHAAPGRPVTFVNRDEEPHTVTGAGGWGTGYKDLREGQNLQARFAEPGLYLYDCVIHPGMVGAVYVSDGEGVKVANSEAVTVAESVSDEAGSGEAEAVEELEAEAAAATEDAPSVGTGAVAVFGLAVVAGYGLARGRRRPSDRKAG